MLTQSKRFSIFFIIALSFAAFCGCSDGKHHVTLGVTIPSETPADDMIYVKVYGNSYKMQSDSKTHFSVSFEAKDDTIAYTYMRNNIGFECAEEFSPDESPNTWNLHRNLKVKDKVSVEDVVIKWRWLPSPNEPMILPPTSAASSTNFVARVNGFKFMAGMALLDYWNPGFQELSPRAAAHFVENHANWVLLSLNPVFSDEKSLNSTIIPWPAQGNLDEAAQRTQTKSFRAAGMNIAYQLSIMNGIRTVDQEENSEFWDGAFAVYGDYVRTVAKIAQEEGVGLLMLNHASLLPGVGHAPPENSVRWQKLLSSVRNIYTGKIGFNLGWSPDAPELLPLLNLAPVIDLFDMVGGIMWDKVANTSTPTLAEIQTSVADQFDKLIKPIWEKYGKPVYFSQVAYPSATAPYLGSNTYPADDPRIGTYFPYDKTVAVDQIAQALIYEVILSEIAKRPYIVGMFPFGQGYWKSIDKNYTLWGKSAESIVSGWYNISH